MAEAKEQSPGMFALMVTLKIIGVLISTYLFLFGLDLMGGSFSALGSKGAGNLFTFSDNPIAGLMVGILATVLVQSSSTSTSIVVGLVGADVLSVRQAIPIIMGANIGTSVTNTIVTGPQFFRHWFWPFLDFSCHCSDVIETRCLRCRLHMIAYVSVCSVEFNRVARSAWHMLGTVLNWSVLSLVRQCMTCSTCSLSLPCCPSNSSLLPCQEREVCSSGFPRVWQMLPWEIPNLIWPSLLPPKRSWAPSPSCSWTRTKTPSRPCPLVPLKPKAVARTALNTVSVQTWAKPGRRLQKRPMRPWLLALAPFLAIPAAATQMRGITTPTTLRQEGLSKVVSLRMLAMLQAALLDSSFPWSFFVEPWFAWWSFCTALLWVKQRESSWKALRWTITWQSCWVWQSLSLCSLALSPHPLWRLWLASEFCQFTRCSLWPLEQTSAQPSPACLLHLRWWKPAACRLLSATCSSTWLEFWSGSLSPWCARWSSTLRAPWAFMPPTGDWFHWSTSWWCSWQCQVSSVQNSRKWSDERSSSGNNRYFLDLFWQSARTIVLLSF